MNSGPAGVWTNSGHPWTWMQKKKKLHLYFHGPQTWNLACPPIRENHQDRRGRRSCESVINRNRRHAPVKFQRLQIQEALFQKYSVCIQADSEKCSSCKVLVSFLWCCFGDSSLSAEARNLIGIHCMTMHPDRFRSFVILKEWCYRWTCTWSFHACESKQWQGYKASILSPCESSFIQHLCAIWKASFQPSAWNHNKCWNLHCHCPFAGCRAEPAQLYMATLCCPWVAGR